MKSKLLKKLLSAMLVGIVVCSLAACSGGTGEEEQPETQETAENADTEVGEGTALIAYFSWSGNTVAYHTGNEYSQMNVSGAVYWVLALIPMD